MADETIKPKPIQDRINRAVNMVVDYFNSHSEKTDGFELTANEVYVVWFNSTLNNWKAMVSTTIPDGMYYEVTYNWAKGETYVDAYKKFNNVCIKDEWDAPDPTPKMPLPVSFAEGVGGLQDTIDETVRANFLAGKNHPEDITGQRKLYPLEWSQRNIETNLADDFTSEPEDPPLGWRLSG
jgi:hypothetical protein